MPSPLSGFTQPAASPISAQLRPGDAGHRAAHRQQRRGRRAQVAGEPELLAALRRRSSCISGLSGDVGGPLRGRQGADADVHLAGPPSGKIQPYPDRISPSGRRAARGAS